jgi:hypothetical protein
MWTIGFQPNGCASPVYRARRGAENGEMLAFAHIPTGATSTSKNFYLDFKKGEQRPALAHTRQGSERNAWPGPAQKAGPVFFAMKGAKNLPVPRQQARF